MTSSARRSAPLLTMAALVALSAGCASAQSSQPVDARARQAQDTPGRSTPAMIGDSIGTPHDDVVLEVPRLWVDSLGLEVDSLTARLSLNANVINLVSVAAGVDLAIDSVVLQLEGVSAEAYLYVDLDNVARLVDRTITTLEQNPEIVTTLLSAVDTVVSTVGEIGSGLVAPGGALTRTVDELGRTVEQTVTATGDLVERTLDSTGQIVNRRTLSRLADLELLNETTNAAGHVVRRVRDTAGRVIEYVTDTAGNVTRARIVGGGR